jgi:hypothetical protein
MTEEADWSAAGKRVEASEVDGRWFIRRVDTQFWGEGASLAEAYDDLGRRESEYAKFLERAGVPVIPVTGFKRWLRRVGRPAGRLFAALAIFALFMVPVSYAISMGIARGVKQSEIKIGGRAFWTKLEQGLIDFSKEKHDLPPEQAEALRQAVHRIVARIRPFTSELRLLLEPVGTTPPRSKGKLGESKPAESK